MRKGHTWLMRLRCHIGILIARIQSPVDMLSKPMRGKISLATRALYLDGQHGIHSRVEVTRKGCCK